MYDAGQQAGELGRRVTRVVIGGYGGAQGGHIEGEGTIQFPDIAEVKPYEKFAVNL